MNPNELQQALIRLHEELAHTTEVDEATRQALTNSLADIQRVISGSAEQRSSADQPEAAMSLKLQSAIESFEANHPRLTAVLQQVVDRLAEMGI